MKIYEDYSQEPEEIYLPLPQELYPQFYSLEMDCYSDDLPFYLDHIKQDNSTLLEAGCGTGRLSRLLRKHTANTLVAIDNSFCMLQQAQQSSASGITYLCMDMCNLSFSRPFDCIIIPYNTLNLLENRQKITQCLASCYAHLRKDGELLLHLHAFEPNAEVEEKSKIFQFQLFSISRQATLIRETLRSYSIDRKLLFLEERFKLRYPQNKSGNINYRQCSTLFTPTRQDWLNLLTSCGFSILSVQDIAEASSAQSCTLHIVAKKVA